eukprot:scaffold250610_cov30-Tisochrysis_lutea.AAC.12
MRKLLTAPRASKCSLIGPPMDCAAGASRGTRSAPSQMAISGSAWGPLMTTVPNADTSTHARKAAGASCLAERARPVTPARLGWEALAT